MSRQELKCQQFPLKAGIAVIFFKIATIESVNFLGTSNFACKPALILESTVRAITKDDQGYHFKLIV
jgi:hypothetical protein